jgi:putative FmdB family regulatory protein
MPIYEYCCGGCGNKFERLQKISDKPLTTCPQCGKRVQRLISQTSFALRGEGWYKDGYAKGGKKESKPKAQKADQKGGKGEKNESKGD